MEKNNRPISRQKKVSGGSDYVHKRGQGLNGTGHSSGSYGNGPERSGGGGLFKLIVIALVVLLGGGGTAGSMLSGGMPSLPGSTGAPSGSVLTGGYTGNVSDWQDSVHNTLATSQGTVAPTYSEGTADTSVSEMARAKRTSIIGNGQDQVTLMVFMCGTDLESRSGMATSDIQEMLNARISDKVNVLVYTGGCKRWKNNVMSSSTNQIYQVTSGGLKCLEKDLGSRAMTDPDTLSWFIRWGAKNYPANRYELIMWDHGGGSISGYGYDETKMNGGSMTMDKINKALADGGVNFDFVGFDACLMATLETALAVEPYADYMIASEETEPGVGWYYTNWLTKLSDNTSMPTVEIGKNIIDDFVSVCRQKTPNSQTTLSITDLAELKGTVPDKFKSFAQSTTDMIKNDQYQKVSNARTTTKEFGKNNKIDQVDLIQLAESIGTKEAKSLAEALRGAVKYNRTSTNINNANGISIYFPYGRTSSVKKMANMYQEIGLDASYTKCIQSFASVETSGQVISGGNSGQMDSLFGSLGSGGGSYTVQSTMGGDEVAAMLAQLLGARSIPEVGLSEEESGFLDEEALENNEKYLAKNQFDASELKWTEKDGQNVLVLKEKQWDLLQKVELNVFVDDGEGYIDLGMDNVYDFNDDGDLIGSYDKTWIAINGQIVAYYLMSAEGNENGYTIIGRVPALLNGERVNLMLQFTDENPDGVVTGAALAYDEDSQTMTQAKGEIEIQTGDVIDFICDYYDYARNYSDSYMLGERLRVDGDLTISNVEMRNGDYIAAYRLTDIYNNHFWTPSIQ